MKTAIAKVLQVDDFGLCVVELPECGTQAVLTLDRLRGYRGKRPRSRWIKPGALMKVEFEEDGERIASASLHTATP